MIKRIWESWISSLSFFALALIFSGCASPKESRYFDGMTEGVYSRGFENPDPIIQRSDILSITVSSLNPQASALFNAPLTTIPMVNNPNSISELTGYLVNPEGKITFPILGDIQAAGYTKKQLKDSITAAILERKLLVDPIINIRILNFRVTVLGEVLRPGILNVPNEKISILEAIGFAGDMTLYAKRDNVLLIRNENGKKITKRINLNTDEIFNSPYYYLKSNDIIYIESNKSRVQSTSRANQLVPIILSAMAFLAVIFDRYTR